LIAAGRTGSSKIRSRIVRSKPFVCAENLRAALAMTVARRE
jgi:hypothetical protein